MLARRPRGHIVDHRNFHTPAHRQTSVRQTSVRASGRNSQRIIDGQASSGRCVRRCAPGFDNKRWSTHLHWSTIEMTHSKMTQRASGGSSQGVTDGQSLRRALRAALRARLPHKWAGRRNGHTTRIIIMTCMQSRRAHRSKNGGEDLAKSARFTYAKWAHSHEI